MQTYRQIITTDANGDASVDVNMKIPFLFSNLRGFFSAGRIEFVRLYGLIKKGATTQDIGGDGDGGGGGGGISFRSPMQISVGKFVGANMTLTLVLHAGKGHATADFTVLFDWQKVEQI